MDGIEILTQEIPCVNDLPHTYQATLEIISNLTNNPRGYCFAKNKKLAELRRVNIGTIKRHIAILTEAGYASIQHVGRDRRLFVPEPIALQVRHLCATYAPRVNTTKRETQENTNVSPNENLEEENKQEESHDDGGGRNTAVRHSGGTQGGYDDGRNSLSAKAKGVQNASTALQHATNSRTAVGQSEGNRIAYVADAPTLPKQIAVEKVNGRGDASETPGGLAEVDLLIEERDCAGDALASPLPAPARDKVLTVSQGGMYTQTTKSIPQQDNTAAPTEATNETTILSDLEREDSHYGTSKASTYRINGNSRATAQSRGSFEGSGRNISDTGKPHGNKQCCHIGTFAGSICNERDRKRDTRHIATLETLTAHGVDITQAQRITSQHTQEAIARAIAYANQEEARKGRLTNKAGFIVSALSAGWHFKLLDVSPEGIKKRQERLRIRTEGATMVMGGVAPDMAYLRGRLSA